MGLCGIFRWLLFTEDLERNWAKEELDYHYINSDQIQQTFWKQVESFSYWLRLWKERADCGEEA